MPSKLEKENKRLLENLKLGASCLGCMEFDQTTEQCLLFKARPPVKVIILGCDEYEADIPF